MCLGHIHTLYRVWLFAPVFLCLAQHVCVCVVVPDSQCPSQCYKEEEHSAQCPVCSKPFNALAKPLPFAHCSQSYLICSLSGNPMNEHNPPMALPNGYVYGEQVGDHCALICRQLFLKLGLARGSLVFVFSVQALVAMAAENGGQVMCPRTKDTFKMSDVKKVYVM